MNAKLERLACGEPLGVDVEAIEHEFAALWREASAEESGSDRKPVTRACLANLLLWVESDDVAASLRAALDELITSVPARVMVLRPTAEFQGGQEFESYISANCVLAPGGGKLVCSEEVTLEARGPGLMHLSPVVRALLVPDVPTIMCVPAAPALGIEPLTPLLSMVDRLLINSLNVRDPAALDVLDQLRSLVRVTVDGGWMEMAPVRFFMASVFDHPEALAALAHLQTVWLHTPSRLMANRLLLLGWLMDRLGLADPRRIDQGSDRVRLHVRGTRGGSGVVEVRVVPDGTQSVLGLETDQGSITATFNDEPEVIMQSLGLPPRHMARDVSSLGECLARAMGPRAPDPLFDPAWKSARALWRAMEDAWNHG